MEHDAGTLTARQCGDWPQSWLRKFMPRVSYTLPTLNTLPNGQGKVIEGSDHEKRIEALEQVAK